MLSRARREPSSLFAGIDASHDPLIEASRHAPKLCSKGQPPNALFVLGAAEALPGPFAGLASSVSILFPWGSLLRAVLAPDCEFLERLAGTCRHAATIEVVTAIHPEADARELARLGLTGASVERAAAAWCDVFSDVRVSPLPSDHAYQTTWWRKIRQREGRTAIRLSARAP